ANFCTWLLTAASMPARPSANLARSACSAEARRSRPSASLRVWLSTAWSMPARASARRAMSVSNARDTTWRAFSRRPAKSLARAAVGEVRNVAVERTRHVMAGVLQAAGEVAGAGVEHGGGRHDDIGHLGADAGLALVDHAEQRFLALAERGGDFLGALDQRL